MTARERLPNRRVSENEQRPTTFVLKIQGRSGAAGIHALRVLLKILLRQHGFRCLDAREVHDRASPDDPRRP
jgi:hypothetical protein